MVGGEEVGDVPPRGGGGLGEPWFPHSLRRSDLWERFVRSLEHCRAHKALRVHAWVILDNHFHGILAGPALAETIRDWKRFTAGALLKQLREGRRECLLNQPAYYCAAHKTASERPGSAGRWPVAARQTQRTPVGCASCQRSSSDARRSRWAAANHRPAACAPRILPAAMHEPRAVLRHEGQPDIGSRFAAAVGLAVETCSSAP